MSKVGILFKCPACENEKRIFFTRPSAVGQAFVPVCCPGCGSDFDVTVKKKNTQQMDVKVEVNELTSKGREAIKARKERTSDSSN